MTIECQLIKIPIELPRWLLDEVIAELHAIHDLKLDYNSWELQLIVANAATQFFKDNNKNIKLRFRADEQINRNAKRAGKKTPHKR